MKFFEKLENGIIFRENGETVKITAWGKDSLRTESVFLGDIPEDNAALLPAEKTDVEVTIGEWNAVLVNGGIMAELKVQEWGHALQITYKNKKGDVLLKEISNGGALQKRARYYRHIGGENYYLKASFEGAEEKIYGMGQYQQEVMDLKGCNLELAHRNSQASVPFYISTRGYGFLWNNAAVGSVHFGSNTMEWEAQNTKKLDYFITAGDTPADIERNYMNAVGKAPMMPEYGLGFWQCKLRYFNEQQVIDIAEEYHKRGIPVDVLVIDYYHWLRCGDWRFDKEFFPEPEKMVARLKELGIETMVSIWPQVDSRSENYEELKQQGMLVRSNQGVDVQMLFHGNNSFMDATNPRTRKYVWEKIKKNYYDMGIKTFWLDEAEPEFGTYDYEQYRYHAGEVTEIGNIYPREYSRMFYEGQKECGQDDIVNLVRCAWVGSQRYGALVWSGDIMSSYEDFRKQICAGLHMGLAGIPWWTTDIGGFHAGDMADIRNPEYHELLIRWFQFGTFCPVMRIHGCRAPQEQVIAKDGEVREWTGAPNEVWSYGEENEKIMTRLIGVRTMMKDYIRDVMKNASENGDPVMRTVFYEFPQDKNVYDLKDQFMFGSDILVCPVVEPGVKSRSVYLPEGASWTLAHDGKVYEGGQTVEIETPIETFPVFLRDGKQEYLIGQI